MNEIKIDPKIFISPPFRKCPKCGMSDTFGTLMVGSDDFTRRCSKCWYTDSIPLPELTKKIVYLDQSAISNMMKALNSKTEANKKGRVAAFWQVLFEKLDRLCKLQLIVCPDSHAHEDESLMSAYYKDLKRMYELLSHGITFEDFESIRSTQLYEHASNWISGNPEKPLSLNVHDVVYGDINAWQSRINVSINMSYKAAWIDDMRRTRDLVCADMVAVFKRWQAKKGKPFKYFFEQEYEGLIREWIYGYMEYLKRWDEISHGNAEVGPEDILPPSFYMMIQTIHDVFESAGIQEAEIWNKTIEYLSSEYIKDIPFIKISGMLFAAIARKAAAGQKQPPGQGMSNDINVISVLLPYCDAMFIDKECHAYLQEVPLRDEINYGTNIYSVNNRDEFLEFLDSIEKSASDEHLFWVRQTYGDEWANPYTTLYVDKQIDDH